MESMEMSDIMQELLLELLDYDELTGSIKWKERGPHLFKDDETRSAESRCKWWNARFAGEDAGSWVNDKGYHVCKIMGKKFRNHRVIWMMKCGRWPENIDHIDRDRRNNRWGNLRESSLAGNNKNKSIQKNNTSGFTGVNWVPHAGKWQARIGGKGRSLGYFTEIQDAVEAREEALSEEGYQEGHGIDQARALLSEIGEGE